MPNRASMFVRRAKEQRHHLPTLQGQWQVLLVAIIIIAGQWWVAQSLTQLRDGLNGLRPFVPVAPLVAALLLAISVVAVILPNVSRTVERAFAMALIVVLTIANIAYIAMFTWLAFRIPGGTSALAEHLGIHLVIDGAVLWSMNVGVFAIAFWEVDGPGPAHRAVLPKGEYNDFLFPQQQPDVEPNWLPRFSDYLYTALTNAIAFSPTDAMPVTRTSKSLMALQSLTSVATLLVLLARSINIAQ